MVELCTNRWWNCVQTGGGTVYRQVVELCTNRWWNCVQKDINKYGIKNWNVRSRNRADWEKCIKEAKVRTGLKNIMCCGYEFGHLNFNTPCI
jgi:hypothetical protein